MRITQGTFSYLPDFSDEEIAEQIQYCLDNNWPIAVEHTDAALRRSGQPTQHAQQRRLAGAVRAE